MPKKKDTVHFGLAIFLTVGAILLFYDTLAGRRVALGIFAQLISALQPVIYGAFLAYLLAPVADFFEDKLFRKQVEKSKESGQLIWMPGRAVSILLIWAIISVLLYLLMSVLLPELYKSILQLFNSVESYYNTISGWVEHMLETNPTLEAWVGARMDGYYAAAKAWFERDVLSQATVLMGIVGGGVFGIVAFFSDLLVGIIVSVYFVGTKEIVAAHACKAVYALLPREKVYWLLRGTRKVDRIFSGFVRGKLLDSLIIGILCFIGCSILKMPYTPLVSLIVGVTNVIPFFGPFLGAIPSIFLILLVSPLQALYFSLFVLALQQLDGNVIGPAILGDKTGLSSIWVIVAILVGGSFFGFVGMFFGVPVCACLFSLVTFLVETRLQKKELPVETRNYTDEQYIRPAEPTAQQGEKE